MLKSENFVVIQGWMCNELNLKGNELLVFALIYGFSQDGESKFNGGRKYIAETFNISLPTVDKALQNLINYDYIEKHSNSDFINTDEYRVNIGVVKELYQGSKETLSGGSKETLLNNISNTKKEKSKVLNNKLFNTTTAPKKDNLYTKCVKQIEEFTDDGILQSYLTEFLKRCLENSRDANIPFYVNSFKGKLNNLKKLSTDNEIQRKIVLQTLDNGWNGFYELKENKKEKSAVKRLEKLSSSSNKTYDRETKGQFTEEIGNGNAEKF